MVFTVVHHLGFTLKDVYKTGLEEQTYCKVSKENR